MDIPPPSPLPVSGDIKSGSPTQHQKDKDGSLNSWHGHKFTSRRVFVAFGILEAVVISLAIAALWNFNQIYFLSVFIQVVREVMVIMTAYDIKINQMGFGYQGIANGPDMRSLLSTMTNLQGGAPPVVPSLALHGEGVGVMGLQGNGSREDGGPGAVSVPGLMRTAVGALRLEIDMRQIEFSSLLDADCRVVASGNEKQQGEAWDVNGLAAEVIRDPGRGQLKATELLTLEEYEKESPPVWSQRSSEALPAAPNAFADRQLPYGLIRYTLTPVFALNPLESANSSRIELEQHGACGSGDGGGNENSCRMRGGEKGWTDVPVVDSVGRKEEERDLLGVLVSGDLVNGKTPIVDVPVSALRNGYAGVFYRVDNSGKANSPFLLATQFMEQDGWMRVRDLEDHVPVTLLEDSWRRGRELSNRKVEPCFPRDPKCFPFLVSIASGKLGNHHVALAAIATDRKRVDGVSVPDPRGSPALLVRGLVMDKQLGRTLNMIKMLVAGGVLVDAIAVLAVILAVILPLRRLAKTAVRYTMRRLLVLEEAKIAKKSQLIRVREEPPVVVEGGTPSISPKNPPVHGGARRESADGARGVHFKDDRASISSAGGKMEEEGETGKHSGFQRSEAASMRSYDMEKEHRKEWHELFEAARAFRSPSFWKVAFAVLINLVGLAVLFISTVLTHMVENRVALLLTSSDTSVQLLAYNLKIDQMGFGFKGVARQTDMRVLAGHTVLRNETAILPELDAYKRARGVLSNELQNRQIEIAALVDGRNGHVLAAPTLWQNEFFMEKLPDELCQVVARASARNAQVKATVRVRTSEFMRFGAPRLRHKLNPDTPESGGHPQDTGSRWSVFRVVVTPVVPLDPSGDGWADEVEEYTDVRPQHRREGTRRRIETASAVLLSGDLLQGKTAINEAALQSVHLGFVGMYGLDLRDGSLELLSSAWMPIPETYSFGRILGVLQVLWDLPTAAREYTASQAKHHGARSLVVDADVDSSSDLDRLSAFCLETAQASDNAKFQRGEWWEEEDSGGKGMNPQGRSRAMHNGKLRVQGQENFVAVHAAPPLLVEGEAERDSRAPSADFQVFLIRGLPASDMRTLKVALKLLVILVIILVIVIKALSVWFFQRYVLGDQLSVSRQLAASLLGIELAELDRLGEERDKDRLQRLAMLKMREQQGLVYEQMKNAQINEEETGTGSYHFVHNCFRRAMFLHSLRLEAEKKRTRVLLESFSEILNVSAWEWDTRFPASIGCFQTKVMATLTGVGLETSGTTEGMGVSGVSGAPAALGESSPPVSGAPGEKEHSDGKEKMERRPRPLILGGGESGVASSAAPASRPLQRASAGSVTSSRPGEREAENETGATAAEARPSLRPAASDGSMGDLSSASRRRKEEGPSLDFRGFWTERVMGAYRGDLEDAINRCAFEGTEWQQVVLYERSDGQIRWFECGGRRDVFDPDLFFTEEAEKKSSLLQERERDSRRERKMAKLRHQTKEKGGGARLQETLKATVDGGTAVVEGMGRGDRKNTPSPRNSTEMKASVPGPFILRGWVRDVTESLKETKDSEKRTSRMRRLLAASFDATLVIDLQEFVIVESCPLLDALHSIPLAGKHVLCTFQPSDVQEMLQMFGSPEESLLLQVELLCDPVAGYLSMYASQPGNSQTGANPFGIGETGSARDSWISAPSIYRQLGMSRPLKGGRSGPPPWVGTESVICDCVLVAEEDDPALVFVGLRDLRQGDQPFAFVKGLWEAHVRDTEAQQAEVKENSANPADAAPEIQGGTEPGRYGGASPPPAVSSQRWSRNAAALRESAFATIPEESHDSSAAGPTGGGGAVRSPEGEGGVASSPPRSASNLQPYDVLAVTELPEGGPESSIPRRAPASADGSWCSRPSRESARSVLPPTERTLSRLDRMANSQQSGQGSNQDTGEIQAGPSGEPLWDPSAAPVAPPGAPGGHGTGPWMGTGHGGTPRGGMRRVSSRGSWGVAGSSDSVTSSAGFPLGGLNCSSPNDN
uniref:Uncharacterized protein n=1 Tax=Chromera velia CCMP2878 TaxID=1169474 RepID=A0A0K6S5U5_9ALVE|eukprot:Cvel_14794.t2-p1 / transcript=Cvel_14794.t2 / gene=Cvel_14794 / organism=Chromera_velia_CCMP2878 / gene_product=hypothetical protein / transcript_product=hypothetical protein / location=Cvel_scaffold1066:36870-55555(+) / protein_length=1996 / sequence_SO=supercontig / SO=protein_coding / is_pseudo=false